MAPVAEDGSALPTSDDGREKNDEPESRAGRSESPPNMEEMDMLLPGRWDWPEEGSRESMEDEGGAFADCAREP